MYHLYGVVLLEIEQRGLDKITNYNLILYVITDTFMMDSRAPTWCEFYHRKQNDGESILELSHNIFKLL